MFELKHKLLVKSTVQNGHAEWAFLGWLLFYTCFPDGWAVMFFVEEAIIPDEAYN
jgi:hypothetical protein